MSWVRVGALWPPSGGEFVDEKATDANGTVHRCTLVAPVGESADNARDARNRLADKLERMAREIRR